MLISRRGNKTTLYSSSIYVTDMARSPLSQPLDELLTVRDWLRYAVTRFESSNLAYGHGTQNALDEAAFLTLSLLHLPIDDVNPWLDARLTSAERAAIFDVIEKRISTRKPAPYLIQRAWIGPHRFYVDERVIVPRSYIGELLVRGELAQILPAQGDSISNILELCTGSGCLAILLALAFPAAHVVAGDISQDALDVARQNVDSYGLQERITLVRSDLFKALPPNSFDLIVANPPYVTQHAVDAFPPEFRAEPKLAHLGGEDGMDIVHAILAGAAAHLAAQGTLVMEVGDARDTLESARPDLPFLWIDTETSEGEVFALTASDLAPSVKQEASATPARKAPRGGQQP